MFDMLEDVVEGIVRYLLSALRGLRWLIWDVCLQWPLEALGWSSGRLLSLGHWPTCTISEIDQLSSGEYLALLILGALSAVALGILLFKYVF